MITAGSMQERVTIIHPVVVRGEFGEQSRTWNDGSTVWANVQYLRGHEAVTAGEVWLAKTISITMRNNKELTERCRLRWNEKNYRITSANRNKKEGSMSIVAEYIEEDNL